MSLGFVLLGTAFLSFLGGAWYNQHAVGKKDEVQGERRVLHYVDPMNPMHTSDKPGAAPCGMPMEPVYEDQESAGSDSAGPILSASSGGVNISPQKQQIIGVEIGSVEMATHTHAVRTLGRITVDEDRVYPLIAASEEIGRAHV